MKQPPDENESFDLELNNHADDQNDIANAQSDNKEKRWINQLREKYFHY
ncbi:MAG: hypothetical protein IPI65_10945 [Bacteroidetes bacterium]|nr:hypothetical protein [Bacteroidota bacterium]